MREYKIVVLGSDGI
ncbi:unnamed protein product, partial [Rotaria sp. Silwood2]